jgi:hypothetical protein
MVVTVDVVTLETPVPGAGTLTQFTAIVAVRTAVFVPE